ncbi:ABC transporter substrate-binding protein [Blastococcus sp. SYSU DS0828]
MRIRNSSTVGHGAGPAPALALTMALTLVLAACGGGSGGGSDEVAAPTLASSDELDELVAAAEEEGCLTVYGTVDETILQSVTDAFSEQYGIPVSFVRLVSADLSQRFATEAQAGATVADVVLLTVSPFYGEALGNGWLQPVDEAGLPAFPGEFPDDYTADDGATPVISLVPTTMVYNTDLVTEPPTSWEAYADPANKGELLLAEPSSSPANVSFWQLMREEYGDDFLQAVASNEPRWYNSAVPATQGVAAGEGALGFPGVSAIVAGLQEQNAPVDAAVLTPTTGPEIGLGLAADSPCQNAGKLFANYLLSEEGNSYFNEVSDAISPFGEDAQDFVRPTPVPEAEAAEISALLGAS